jgi:hypothetical protein
VSHSTIDRAANDPQLQERVKAAVYKILYTDTDCRATSFGQAVLNGGVFGNSNQLLAMYWAVAVATEVEYNAAITQGNGSPGFDTTVISDQKISDIIQGVWPMAMPPETAPNPTL